MTIEILGKLDVEKFPPHSLKINDFSEIIKELEKIEIGEGIEIKTDLPLVSIGQGVRTAAIRRGFAAKIRTTSKGVNIFKLAYKPRIPKNKETLQILEDYRQGKRPSEIAADLGLSRQAIEQRIIPYKKWLRLDDNDAFIAPYLAAINKDSPQCIHCHKPVGKNHRKGGACIECNKIITIRTRIASHLRGFARTGRQFFLANAVSQIKIHDIQPEDLKDA